ncbi:MAG: NAD-dependent epimerase/dehydratase family protein [Planctomycetes bacterium]|jgi:dihydroflavonol-4-reductase|nr:NAD-dependent epimerase/dehydratase family protein [Planctomycetota bacterium]MCL4729870.1 NAD-dependent epimerase/dehydratase family protein [Planctomycetota bacterium]
MADRVLLLGGAGTVGSRVATALAEAGYAVRCLARSRGHRNLAVARASGCEITYGDMNDAGALRAALDGCRFFVHCAAPYPHSGLALRRKAMLDRWIPQIRAQFALARQCGVERAVFTSSLSTIGPAPPGELAHEELAYDPARQGGGNYYPVKHALEQAVLAETAAGPPTVIVNPTGLCGEGSRNPELSAACVFFAGLTPLMVDARLNFVDTRDCARGHVLALQRGTPGRRYILGGVNTTLRKFAGRVTARAGISRPLVVPRFLAGLGAWANEWLGLVTGRVGALSLTSYYHLKYGQHYSSARAQAELGYQPTADLGDAIERELRWHAAVPVTG